ncbi:carbohydrate ABC transporter permease [Gracilibacillus alcaliphilus]|uniref:carbohydrate ABC transporter permease n=1 Tax=Gracilibacillus alcaliphilus TaxID=1401441 RepID=UPI001956EA62|nr:sugar ABC transporter permease [Gracilibacillus alcaliphilus]MBM7675677.1 multiple sugar transport system permease protein [Gracilibacillus alcaliphilus]
MKIFSQRNREAVAAYLFILPAFGLLLLFILNPMAQSLITSFYDVNLISDQRSFLGMENYQHLLNDASFYQSLGNSFYFAILVIPIQTALALTLALLVKRSFPGVGVFRTIYFIPFIISMGVASSIFRMMYNKEAGLFNVILDGIGLPVLPFLSNPDIAMIGIVILGTWKSMGFFMIVFLAGLNNIPNDLYEAAQIDGAGPIKRFFSITLPLLKKVMAFVIIITTMDALKIFIPIYVTMAGGGPAGSTRTAAYFIYNHAFQHMDMGYATAAAFIFFIIILIISLIQMRVLRSDVEY